MEEVVEVVEKAVEGLERNLPHILMVVVVMEEVVVEEVGEAYLMSF